MACCRPRVALPLLGAGVYVVREPLAAAWECEVTAAAARLYAGLWLRLVRSVKVRWKKVGQNFSFTLPHCTALPD